MSRALEAIRFFLLLSLGLLLAGTSWVTRTLYRPLPLPAEKMILEIKKGESVRHLARELKQKRIIRHPLAFLAIYRLTFAPGHIKAGEYVLVRPETLKSLFLKFLRGQVWLHPITVREGMTAQEVASLFLSLEGSPEDLSRALNDPSLVADLDPKARDLEGYLFPETYYFPKGITAHEAFAVMINQFRKVFSLEWRERGRELGLSIREVVTLASLIEKETSLPEERPLVSAVFHNRLKLGMKLDCDPTVLYALERAGQKRERLLKEDLKFPSPYNTYLYAGLPPGPICNPGRASLEAALFPAKVSFLYFVSRNDGSHHFSTTLKEHLRAVALYQKTKARSNRTKPR